MIYVEVSVITETVVFSVIMVFTDTLRVCDNRFLGCLSCYPCYSKSEGNTLAATKFVRLLEASGSITAKQSNGTRENTQLLGSNQQHKPNKGRT